MKKIIVPLFFICMALVYCTSSKKLYQLPDEMQPAIRLEYEKRCEQGKVLYDLNCGGCHSKKVGKKIIIPDFKPEELRGYAIRISNTKHEENMPDSLVSEEELGIIMTFLQYKRPGN